ncbi:glycoside hydrolase family 48 protein [Amycolatopsis sp. TRM77291]
MTAEPCGAGRAESNSRASLRRRVGRAWPGPKVQSYPDGGAAPTFIHHRFWAQAEIATAFSLHVQLFG